MQTLCFKKEEKTVSQAHGSDRSHKVGAYIGPRANGIYHLGHNDNGWYSADPNEGRWM